MAPLWAFSFFIYTPKVNAKGNLTSLVDSPIIGAVVSMESMKDVKEEFFRLLKEAEDYLANNRGIEVNIKSTALENVILPELEKLPIKMLSSLNFDFRIPLNKFENGLELFAPFSISFSFTKQGIFSHLLKPVIISHIVLREKYYLVINAYFRKKSRAAFELALQDNNIKFNKYPNNRIEIYVPINVEVMEYVI